MKIINFYDTVHSAVRWHNLGEICHDSLRVEKMEIEALSVY